MTQTTGMLNRLGGIDIIKSDRAIETVYRFPKSKNRSRRLHKKLARKFGSQTFERPAAYMMAGKMYAHPEIIEAMVKDQSIVRFA